MRFHSLGYYFYRIVAAISVMVADFCRLALRVDYGHAWRFTSDLGIAAYCKIADLKPVYRESYDTHGLSLSADGRMRC